MTNASGLKNPHIKELAVLQKKPNKEDALKILADIAHRVSYLMKEHHFKVSSLVEFFPKDKRLLGMNVNKGMKVMLRLRNPHDEYQFLPRESIIGTMLHELTHNLFGPHDNKFYGKLDELMGRQWVIEQQGLFDTFLGSGNRLGGSDVGGHSTRDKRLINRARISKLCGTKLGGGSKERSRLTPREMAARAATRRAEDNRWCGEAGNENAEVRGLIPSPNELQVIVIDGDEEAEKETSNDPEIIDLT